MDCDPPPVVALSGLLEQMGALGAGAMPLRVSKPSTFSKLETRSGPMTVTGPERVRSAPAVGGLDSSGGSRSVGWSSTMVSVHSRVRVSVTVTELLTTRGERRVSGEVMVSGAAMATGRSSTEAMVAVRVGGVEASHERLSWMSGAGNFSARWGNTGGGRRAGMVVRMGGSVRVAARG